MKKDLNYYLSLPYTIEVVPIPEEEGGGYSAQLPELGKFAIVGDGDTPEEAIKDLNELKKARFKSYLEKGLNIPEPRESREAFSGRFVLRLPKEMHRLLAYRAVENQTSLNTYLVYLLGLALGGNKVERQFETIIERLDVMTDIIWSVDFEKSQEVDPSITAVLDEGAETHPLSDFSRFRKAA